MSLRVIRSESPSSICSRRTVALLQNRPDGRMGCRLCLSQSGLLEFLCLTLLIPHQSGRQNWITVSTRAILAVSKEEFP